MHYQRVAPLIAAALGRIPVTSLFAPEGLDGPVLRIAQLHKALPAHVPTLEVAGASGTHPYLALTADSLVWRVHAYGVGFESWTPSPGDPTRVRFAHVNLTARGGATIGLQRQAARLVRERLNACGLDAFLTLDGPGIMLWVPLDHAPAYPDVRAALHALGRACARDTPEVFEARPDEPADRIRFSVSSNAVGHGAGLPYTLRVAPGLPMNLPIVWSELETVLRDAFDARTSAERLAGGDVLAGEIARIGAQRFNAFAPATTFARAEVGALHETPEPRSEVLTVALRLLGDGKPRSVDELLAEAIRRDLWPKSERRKYVYATLKAYIEKCVARGQKPRIVEDPDRRFRLNHPADDLPDPRPEVAWQAPHDAIDALGATAGGSDPTAFELAVCKAFEALGFCVRHVGGSMNPDGVLDAPLGPLGYRVMLECKSGAGPVLRPDVFEAGKFREAYAAQHCLMVAPGYAGDSETPAEALNHGVALWTVDDLVALLRAGPDLAELRALFAPGPAGDRIGDLLWARERGVRKRLAVICDAIRETAWAAQVEAAAFNRPRDAPLFTEDSAMLVVDDWLRQHDSYAPVTRDEIREAFAYLTNARVAQAVRAGEDSTAIVVLRAV